MKKHLIISRTAKKLALVAACVAIAAGTFATSGDGKSKNTVGSGKLLSLKSSARPGSFSLKTSFNFRGSEVINTQESGYIDLNTSVTYQTGHTSYIVPLKKKIFLNSKVVFNPNAATRR